MQYLFTERGATMSEQDNMFENESMENNQDSVSTEAVVVTGETVQTRQSGQSGQSGQLEQVRQSEQSEQVGQAEQPVQAGQPAPAEGASAAQDGTYRYSYRDSNVDTQGAFAADRIGYSYTSNGQYAHYQMHGTGAAQGMPGQSEKKAAKQQRRQEKAAQKNLKKMKKQERRKSGKYPLGTRMAAAVLCGVLFAGAAYGTCYGIERLTGTKLIIGADKNTGGQDDYIRIPTTGAVDPSAVATQGNVQNGFVIDGDTLLVPVDMVPDVRKIAKNVLPSVVSITSEYTETIQYWGRYYQKKGEGSGSGIIVGQSDDELLICTNYHVIGDADELTVTFIDNTTAKAAVKGTDSRNDLAVIAVRLNQLDKNTLSEIAVARLGDSDRLEVGETVIAIGNALGYGQSVTRGVVSALNRELEDCESPMIQTDAAINPGNSGGALVNAYGEVIGIPSAKIGGSSVEGMGYAIPISVAEPILRELMSQSTKYKLDEKDRGYLGITIVDVESESARLYNMPQGVYIYQVYEGYAADRAGLRRGDIITGVNGTRIESKAALLEELTYYAAGTRITLTVCRVTEDYEAEEVEVVLNSYEEVNSR